MDNILGNTEAFKETGDVLVWRLPRQPPRSDHCLAVHRLRLTAEEVETFFRFSYLEEIITSLKRCSPEDCRF